MRSGCVLSTPVVTDFHRGIPAILTLNRSRLHPFGEVWVNLGFRLWINVGDSSEIPRSDYLRIGLADYNQTRLISTRLGNLPQRWLLWFQASRRTKTGQIGSLRFYYLRLLPLVLNWRFRGLLRFRVGLFGIFVHLHAATCCDKLPSLAAEDWGPYHICYDLGSEGLTVGLFLVN